MSIFADLIHSSPESLAHSELDPKSIITSDLSGCERATIGDLLTDEDRVLWSDFRNSLPSMQVNE